MLGHRLGVAVWLVGLDIVSACLGSGAAFAFVLVQAIGDVLVVGLRVGGGGLFSKLHKLGKVGGNGVSFSTAKAYGRFTVGAGEFDCASSFEGSIFYGHCVWFPFRVV